ncbi:hypothetical protein ACP70R_049188 [Stipagrostis hirtigluma subsp. patula]
MAYTLQPRPIAFQLDRPPHAGENDMAVLARRVQLLFMACAVMVPLCAHAGDPDILTDFVVPAAVDPAQINGTFFTHTGLLAGVAAADPAKFAVTKATAAEFPALLGQSVSFASLVYGAGTVNPPHLHPRASELLLVVKGTLFVGLIDAARNGTVCTQTLAAGDMFVFPKGMVHFQFNNGTGEARALSAFGSAGPGTVSLPAALFDTGIDDVVLEKSFHTDAGTIDVLKHDNQLAPAPAPAQSAGAALLSRPAAMLLCLVAGFLFTS